MHGRKNILRRLLIHVGAFNISLVMRKMLGAGKPRELNNRMTELVSGAIECLINLFRYKSTPNFNTRPANTSLDKGHFITVRWNTGSEMVNFTTGSYASRESYRRAAQWKAGEQSKHSYGLQPSAQVRP